MHLFFPVSASHVDTGLENSSVPVDCHGMQLNIGTPQILMSRVRCGTIKNPPLGRVIYLQIFNKI